MNKLHVSSNHSRNETMNVQNDIQNWIHMKQQGFCPSITVPHKAIRAYGTMGRWEQALAYTRSQSRIPSNAVLPKVPFLASRKQTSMLEIPEL